ncbi:MAG: glycosyltransferase [Clostridium sp.]|nr:glycosyltransferase [Clostridium sp.]
MNTPLLSVIVPVYNTEKYVNRCIDSILSQTYDNIEIIIVDDASDGDIKDIAREYIKCYKNIHLVSHEKNRGLFQARITGLKSAKGEYFAFVDSDDYISCDYYRIMIKKALEENADVVASDHVETYQKEKGLFFPHGMLHQVDWDLKNKEIINMLMSQKGLDYCWWVIWNKIYSIQLWEQQKQFLESVATHLIMCEDIAFSITFLSKATHFVNTHYNYYYYYRNDDASTTSISMSYEKYEKNINDFICAFDISKKALQLNDCWKENKTNWKNWEASIADIWRDKIEKDKKLKKSQRLYFSNLLESLPTQSKNRVFDLSRDFCAHGVKGCAEDWVNEIKRAVRSKKCELVSFDIFDTLIQRPFLTPIDLFHLMDQYVNQLVNSIDYIVFTNIRVRAEQLARETKHAKFPLWEEIYLDDIYEEIKGLCPALSPFLEEIKELEISLEKKYCNARKFGKELFECAKFCGKKVICTSDMYMPESVIKEILYNNNIHPDKIYVSSEIGLTKSAGNLYSYVIKEEKVKASAIVHIGDNWYSDVENARKRGITAFHLPKASDIYCGYNSAIYGGNFYKIFNEQKGIYSAFSANEHWGIRCMQAVIANKLFDNPFVFFDHDSDYNADAYKVGYQALGMNIFAIADWLTHSVIDNGYDNLVFMARDGYLPLKAFEKINKVYKQKINTHYLSLSRKAILPLMINNVVDYYTLYNGFNLSTMSPRGFLKIAKPICKENSLNNADTICREFNIVYSKDFETIEGFCSFAEIFFEEFYDENKAKEYRLDMKEYLAPIFAGRAATFDVGYNGRCESILKENYGFDITAHYIHTNNDRPMGRVQKSGIKIKTLYPHAPFITGIMREQLMSEMTPSCIGYENINGKFEPIYEDDYCVNLQTWFVTHTMQDAALDFVSDMVDIFEEDLKYLAYRYYDACMPLETYFVIPTPADQSIWSGTVFEDDMGMGNNKSLVDFWNHELNRWGSTINLHCGIEEINYDQFPFLKRWLIILGKDWGEGKRRFYRATEHHRIIRGVCRNAYIVLRKIFRLFK